MKYVAGFIMIFAFVMLGGALGTMIGGVLGLVVAFILGMCGGFVSVSIMQGGSPYE